MTLLFLLGIFLLIGTLTIGGGLVSLPLIDLYVVQTGFLSRGMFELMIAVAESTPGPIAINLATYIGINQFGLWGGILTTTSFVLPSILLMWLIGIPVMKNSHIKWIQSILRYLQWTVGAIIFYAVYSMVASSTRLVWDGTLQMIIPWFFIGVILWLTYRFPKYPLLWIALGGIFGFFYY